MDWRATGSKIGGRRGRKLEGGGGEIRRRRTHYSDEYDGPTMAQTITLGREGSITMAVWAGVDNKGYF